MKKVFLSFAVIVTFALFATFSRRNVGINADKYLTPNTTVSTPAPTSLITPVTTSVTSHTPTTASSGKYRNGTYIGSVADAYYGNIQVEAVIQGGKLADVVFLQYPNDRSTSREINGQAMPYLKSEAIQAQSGNVNIVSGATDSSIAFRQSMNSALSKALN